MLRLTLVVALLAVFGCGGDGDGGTLGATTEPAELDSEPVRVRFASGEPATGDPVALISIASAHVEVLALEGVGEVTHVVGSALPCVGDDLSVVLGSSAAFATLPNMAAGDPIDVVVPIGRCRYEAGQVAVIDSADLARTRESVPDGAVLLLVTPGPEEGLSVVVVAGLVGEVELDTTSTSAPTRTTSTTVPIAQTPLPSGRAAVDAFLAAWQAGDRGAALAVADPAQVDLLFAVPAAPPRDRGCTQGDANVAVACVFQLPSGELQVRAAPREGGFIVDFVFHSPN